MFKKLRHNLKALGRDARESILLRWKLAKIEMKADLTNLGWLAGSFLFAVIGILTSIAVLAVWIAQILNRYCPLPAELWTMILGVVMLLISTSVAIFAWRHFGRRWVGLKQTMEELRKDIDWLKEWADKSEEDEAE